MSKLSIIGTSKIVEEHIKVAKLVGFKLFSISSTKKNSINLEKLKKKYKFKFSFNNWRDAINHSEKFRDTCFLIAPRIKDTYKILNSVLKKKKCVFVEKPITTNIKKFNNLLKEKKNIFVGYNRIFYKNVIFIKKNLNKTNNVIVKCPETYKKNILHNSVHILSILIYLFGDLKIFLKKKNKTNLFIFLKNKKNIPIYLFFNFNASENFSIDIYDNNNKRRFFLKPLETLCVYEGMDIKQNLFNKNLSVYKPQLKYKKNEPLNSKFKPGFLAQMKAFKIFLKSKKKINNNITFAKKVMTLAKKISD